MERRQKITVNPLEDTSHQQLKHHSIGNGLAIHAKTSLSQAINIKNAGLSKEETTYALQASFDFVIVREQDRQILYAIEVDGPSHRSPSAHRRDRLKNSICTKLHIPLIRVGPK
ncbi:DUF2726 domain-containing protein, partial [Myxococcus vastator]|uniref:DUF2726 domain-containing protein n=1 Tax=Myxococcus vastator TaxID=2709664 RepID=UPI0013D30AD6